MGHLKMWLLAAVALVSLAALGVASVASANTVIATDDPGAIVSASLLSDKGDPYVVEEGDRIQASFMVTSRMVSKDFINFFVTWDWAGTSGPSWNFSRLSTFQPGQSWGQSHVFEVKEETPPGTYHLKVSAETPLAFLNEPFLLPSVAEATITVVPDDDDDYDD